MKHSQDMAWKLMKKKIMVNNEKMFSAKIKVCGQQLEVMNQFKYIGLIIIEEGTKIKIISRITQTMAAV